MVASALREAYVAWTRGQTIDCKVSAETIGQLNTLKEAVEVYTKPYRESGADGRGPRRENRGGSGRGSRGGHCVASGARRDEVEVRGECGGAAGRRACWRDGPLTVGAGGATDRGVRDGRRAHRQRRVAISRTDCDAGSGLKMGGTVERADVPMHRAFAPVRCVSRSSANHGRSIMDHGPADIRTSEKLTAALDRYDRIRKRIEPFVVPPKSGTPVRVGRWRRGIDLPDDSKERYRVEFCGP